MDLTSQRSPHQPLHAPRSVELLSDRLSALVPVHTCCVTAPVSAQKFYPQVKRIPTRQPPTPQRTQSGRDPMSACLLHTVVFPVFCSALGPMAPWELTSGTKGGSSMWASSRLKLMFLKMGCCLTSTAPQPRQPSLSLGSLARSWKTAGGRTSRSER